MKVWKYKMPEALTFSKRLPTFLGLTRISALLTGQLVYCSTTEYSISISMNRKVRMKCSLVRSSNWSKYFYLVGFYAAFCLLQLKHLWGHFTSNT